MSHVLSRLRSRRRARGLTQRELAIILGLESHAHLSRLESGERHPSIKVAMVAELLFGETMESLFPGLHQSAMSAVVVRLGKVLQMNKTDSSIRGIRKRKFIEEVAGRIPTN